MVGKYEELNIDGEMYPIVYNNIVTRNIQEEFGTISEWSRIFETVARDDIGNILEDKVNGIPVCVDGVQVLNEDGTIFLAKQKEIKIDDVARTFMLMINEGIRQYNKDAVTKKHYIDRDDACELLGYIDGKQAITDLVTKSMPKNDDAEDKSKNAQAEQNQ